MRVTAAAVAALTLLFASGPRAQEKPPDNKDAKPAAPPAVEMTFEKGARLSNEQRLKASEEALTNIRNALRKVLSIQESARRDKDIIRLACVNDKIVPIKGLLRVAEQSAVTLQE